MASNQAVLDKNQPFCEYATTQLVHHRVKYVVEDTLYGALFEVLEEEAMSPKSSDSAPDTPIL